MRELWNIFVSFFKIGVFTFGGGYAMVSLIEDELITRKRWIESDQFLKLLTLAQSAPGPIALNTGVFIGYKVRGWAGALAAVLGIVLPSFVIILLIALFFADIRDNRYVDAAFKGMRPAVVALIVAPVYKWARALGPAGIAASVAAALLVWYVGLSPVYFIVAGAAAGIAHTVWKNRKTIEKP